MSSKTSHKALSLSATIGAAAVAGLLLSATPAHAETEVDKPSSFTSAFTVMATPDAVVNPDGEMTAGEDGAAGTFTYMINSDLEIICYDFKLTGVTGSYESPAKTATHIHEAKAGKPGPPRIAFPNPEPNGDGDRTASGCLEGPFTTGVEVDGKDTGSGFTLSQIEDNPSGFAGDAHTANFPAGVVRGQLTPIPVGGPDTGNGGAAASSVDSTSLTLGGLAVLGAAGIAIHLRRRTQSL